MCPPPKFRSQSNADFQADMSYPYPYVHSGHFEGAIWGSDSMACLDIDRIKQPFIDRKRLQHWDGNLYQLSFIYNIHHPRKLAWNLK